MSNQKKTSDEVPVWVEADEDQVSPSPSSTSNVISRSSSRAETPIIVCVHEWIVGKSNPASLMPRKKKSLARIELLRNPGQGLGINGYRDLELGSEPSDWSQIIQKGDAVIFHLFKRKSQNKSEHMSMQDDRSVSSGSSVSSMGLEGADNYMPEVSDVRDGSEWEGKLSVALEKVSLKLEKSKVLVEFDQGKYNKKKTFLHFPSKKQSNHFFMFVKTLKMNMSKANADSEPMRERGVIPKNFSKPVKFLVEIVSASDLKPVNVDTSDPYVVVKLGSKSIHTTSTVKKNLDPIWTVRTKSMFIFSLHPDNFYSDDLFFDVRDKETLGSDQSLGQAVLPTKKLLKCKGERHVMKLQYIQSGERVQGHLTIRCKKADAFDIEFIENFEADEEFPTKDYYNDFVTPKHGKRKVVPTRRKKKVDQVTYNLARPMQEGHGDQWLTSAQIENLANSPSQFWTEIGGGQVGQLYVEIIGLNGLINLDIGSAIPGDKTDAYVTCAFEDAVIATDVIKDCHSPRFLPWTRRAFKFNISHISSPLYIGCFDYDKGVNKNDPIGRLNITLERFVPNTTYNLLYKLYDTDEVSNRTSRGTLMLRLRVEHKNHRKVFFNSLQSPSSRFTIHLNNKQNHATTQYSVKGYVEDEQFRLSTFFSFLNEIGSYQIAVFAIIGAIKTVFLWRGHWRISFCGLKIYIPLHSMIMLTFVIVCTERPKYKLAIFFATIPWLMLTLLQQRRQRPSMWGKPPRYLSLLSRLILNYAPPQTIEEDQERNADMKYLKDHQAETEGYEAATNKFWEDYFHELDEWEKVNADSTKMHKGQNKSTRFTLFKNILYPIQKFLYDVVKQLRYWSSIFKWDQMYISFWITTVAILLSIASIVVGYYITDDILMLLKRIMIYAVCGPWNKLLDIMFFRDTEKKLNRNTTTKQTSHTRFRDAFAPSQLRREERDKKEAIKRVMFGKEIVVVPNQFNPQRYRSEPSTDSTAFPNKNNPEDDIRDSPRKLTLLGQSLGDGMVPSNYMAHMKSATFVPKSRRHSNVSTRTNNTDANNETIRHGNHGNSVDDPKRPLLSGIDTKYGST